MKRAIRGSICRFVVPAAVAVWLALTSAAATSQEARFRAAGDATFVSVDGNVEFISVTGSATHLGPFEGMRTVRFSGHTSVATTTLVGGGGDSIDIYDEYEWDTHFVQASGFYVITGGTGRFQNATGSGSHSVGPLDPDTRTRRLTWDGTIAT